MENIILYRNSSVIFEMINENEYLLLDTERGLFAGINQTCFQIWDLLKEPITYDNLLLQMKMLYPETNDNEIEEAVNEVIQNMIQNGFVFHDKK